MTYRFGPFEFDPRTGEIRTGSESRRLAPQPARVLTLLLESAGELVTREALKSELWPDTVVEYDKGLNFCVREVRAALGDEAAEPTYLETLPRRGYRFVAPVERVEAGRGASALRLPGSGPGRLVVVAAAVAAVLAGVLAVGGGRSDTGPDPRARELGEMGGYLLTRGGDGDVERSVEFFRRAIAADPEYGRAHAGLGSAYLELARRDEGKAALRRSLELDPEMWFPRVRLGLQALYVDYDRPAATRHFRRALEAAPHQVVVRHTYAWWRAVEGDPDEALRQMEAALELDPVSPRVNGDVGRLFYLAGRHDEAVAHCRRTLELTPDALRPRDCVVHALVQKGAYDEARREALATMEAHGAGVDELDSLTAGPAAGALDAYWRWAGTRITELAEAGRDSHVHAAAAWARAGDPDRAFQALDAAYRARCPVLLQIDLDPALGSLRDDARFRDLLRRVGG